MQIIIDQKEHKLQSATSRLVDSIDVRCWAWQRQLTVIVPLGVDRQKLFYSDRRPHCLMRSFHFWTSWSECNLNKSIMYNEKSKSHQQGIQQIKALQIGSSHQEFTICQPLSISCYSIPCTALFEFLINVVSQYVQQR